MFCGKCGTDMSDNATACPKCGEPTKNTMHSQKKKTSGCAIGCLSIIILLTILGIGGYLIDNDPDTARWFSELCGDASESKDELSQRLKSEGYEYVGAELFPKMIELYSSNELAFKKEWRGKKVFIKGEISEVEEEIKLFGKSGISITVELSGLLQYVQCIFPDMSKDTAATLRKGQKLVVSGEVDDVTLGILQLEKCRLEE